MSYTYIMKWLKRKELAILLLIFIVAIIVGYFTKIKSLIGINDWKDAASVVTIVGIIMGVYYYHSVIKWNFYRYLADLYYEILEKGFQNPEFCDPEKTRKYETEWLSDPKKYKYDVFARMCFAYLEDIYDTASKSSLLLNKKYILKLYAPTFERIKIMHGTWFENNRSTLPMKGFFEFIHFNKWRDYLDSSEAEILRWNCLSYGYDEKILNPLQVKEDNPLLEYISGIKEKELIVADLGCGNGSFIANHLAPDYRFKTIYGIDFSDEMMKNAREKCNKYSNVKFCQINLKDLTPLRKELKPNELDMIFSINSLIASNPNDIDMMLCQISLTLKSGGKFIAVLPSFDTVEYLRTLVFKEFKNNREEYSRKCYKNSSFKEKILEKLEVFYEYGMLSYYFIKLFKRAEYGAWKMYLFSWDEIPGNDNSKLIEFLKQKFGIDWVKTVEIEKIDNGNTIKVSTEVNHLSLNLNQEKTEVIFKIDDVRTDKFMAKMENGKLNIYWKIISLDRKEFGALLDTWKLFYQDRKMNDNKKLYADDGVNIQRFIHNDEIDHMFKKVGLKINKKEKLKYPWNLTKKFDYGYFPNEDEIWDWFVVAEKI